MEKPHLDGPPPPLSSEEMRMAFQTLAAGNPAERALYALISSIGLTMAAATLEVESQIVTQWIWRAEVPPHVHARLAHSPSRRHPRRGPLPGGAKDPRRERFRLLCREGHSTRKIASILGIARDTVMRWREQEKDH